MLHAVGFAGLVFDGLDLLDANGDFIGANALAAYYYGMPTGSAIPIEGNGGSGTAGSHWDEQNFQPSAIQMSNELMTGWIDINEKTFLSDTTIATLTDLGYVTNDISPERYYTVDSHLLIA